jgi:SAM-dependent methyltransferase
MNDDVVPAWENAVRQLLADPAQRQIVLDCYYDQPASAAALRYCESEEWRAIRGLLPERCGYVLDVGAGQGVSAIALAREGFRVRALEPDPSDIVGRGAIRRAAGDLGLDIEVLGGTAERIPLDDASCDLVFARQVMHHTRDLPLACREIHRVLRPGGHFLAVRDHVISRDKDLPAFLAIHPLHHLYGGENAFREDQYLGAMREAGFQVECVLRSFDSVVNFAPYSRDTLREALVERAARVPFAAPLLRAVLSSERRYDSALALLSRIDRRPGRLQSFVCRKPEAA